MAKAFTLIELLVVLAIISVLAAILFPLMRGAKASAQRAVCISNMRQITTAINLYAADYDDYFMLTRHRPEEIADSNNDRTWVQLVLPYVKTFGVFKCPGDVSPRAKPESTFDQDLIPGDTDTRYYTASMRTNYGLNYQYLSPIVISNGFWQPAPRSTTQVSRPSETLLLVDSVWTRTLSGMPSGGGSWLVTPPCRYHNFTGLKVDSFLGYSDATGEVYTTTKGWTVSDDGAPDIYGNAWPWHNGKVNMGMVDGSVRAVDPARLATGCKLEDSWQGIIQDSSSYLWDLR